MRRCMSEAPLSRRQFLEMGYTRIALLMLLGTRVGTHRVLADDH